MSILSSLYHGEIHDKPNDVHNVPAGETDGAARPAQDAGWMRVSLTDAPDGGADGADWNALDAHIADAHAMAASCAYDQNAADRAARGAECTGGSTDGSAALPAHAERRIRALREGGLRPPLYYTQQEQTPCANGVWESPHTVASKLESKEEFPQG